MPKRTKKIDPTTPVRHLSLQKLHIENYKGIDSLDIEFPLVRYDGDPRITVIGSRNGLGKTSILECCSLLLYALSHEDFRKIDFFLRRMRLRLPSERNFTITGHILFDGKESCHSLSFREGIFIVSKINKLLKKEQSSNKTEDEYGDRGLGHLENSIYSILGYGPNPILEELFLHFNSYRKIQETAPELGMLVDSERDPYLSRRSSLSAVSSFKVQIIKSVMFGNQAYFDKAENREAQNSLEILNRLLKEYADVSLMTIEPRADNTLEIILTHQTTGQEFSFDGLSSGQKEIISTLFLIWSRTQNTPKVVLIDEPELHLNRDWQQMFVRDLVAIAPHNQYILATHSVEIADSVDPYQRLLLK